MPILLAPTAKFECSPFFYIFLSWFGWSSKNAKENRYFAKKILTDVDKPEVARHVVP